MTAHGPERPRPPHRTRRVLQGIGASVLAGVLVAGMLAPVAVGAAVATTELTGLTDEAAGARLGDGRMGATTVLLDVEGEPFAHLYDQHREPVGREGISDPMVAAIVAIEDRRFYDHDGVDWYGMGRAVVTNTAGGSTLEGQGASTLTMQYVKNYRLNVLATTPEEERAAIENSPQRKLSEMRLAQRVETVMDKDEILAGYLDLIYFGRGAYGVEVASRSWFGTTADRLDVPQAALLAGMIQAPERFDPLNSPEAAKDRRDTVIAAMVDVGSITAAQGAEARETPVEVRPDAGVPGQGCDEARERTGHFCRTVVDTLGEAGIDAGVLRNGGYMIRTTMDPRATREAYDAVREAGGADGSTDVANVAALVEPGTGRVDALVSSSPYGFDAGAGETAYSLPTVPLHAAGSVYKVFTAAAALEQGIVTPDSDLAVPDTYTSRAFRNGNDPYTVRNAADYPEGMTLQRALATSPNTPFVELTDRLGSLQPAVDMAWRLGLRNSMQAPTPDGGTVGEAVIAQRRASFTLGPEATSPLELANVGATIAAGGVHCDPVVVESVTDRDGDDVALPGPACDRVIDESVARDLVTALSGDATSGTAAGAASAVGWNRPVIAKTGTAQNNSSAAFLGATAERAGAVMTFPTGAPRPVCTGPLRICGSGNLSGGAVPARAWFQMVSALDDGRGSAPLPGDAGDT
ncbi:transglycosylase domain-containing protein [Pseudonocardia nematodicida]|uniref:Transglycosylase domain-containing protein n=1 Tax=Pseudonocardia nematodicida TaxID=1206997 RepID=A0ABV1K8U6_9PSEU